MDAWKGSEGHNTNMLGNYRRVAGNWNDWANDPRHPTIATRTVSPPRRPRRPSLGCGDAPAEPNSVAETMLAILRRSLLIRGFINTEFAPQLYQAFLSEITPLVHSGRIRYREHVVEGLDAAPQAFIGMLEGHNFGKTLVRVS